MLALNFDNTRLSVLPIALHGPPARSPSHPQRPPHCPYRASGKVHVVVLIHKDAHNPLHKLWHGVALTVQGFPTSSSSGMGLPSRSRDSRPPQTLAWDCPRSPGIRDCSDDAKTALTMPRKTSLTMPRLLTLCSDDAKTAHTCRACPLRGPPGISLGHT